MQHAEWRAVEQAGSSATSPSAAFFQTEASYDAAFEIGRLERMVSKRLKDLNLACGRMDKVEAALKSFLDEYYGQVGHFFERLESLRHQIQHYERQITQSSRKRSKLGDNSAQKLEREVEALQTEVPAVPLDMRKSDLQTEIKDIYRRLAKRFHPDVSAGRLRSQHILQLLNQAYAKNNLWAMREMEHSLMEYAHTAEDTPEAKRSRLRERFDVIASSIARVEERERRLLKSAAWQLKERVQKDPYLVEVVIHRAKQQIEEAQQLLVRKRIEYKAMALI